MMQKAGANLTTSNRRVVAWLILLSLVFGAPLTLFGDKKKKKQAAEPNKIPVMDYSSIVWPNPPAVARIRYQAFYAAHNFFFNDTATTEKAKWMDRLAGTT